MTVGVEIKGRVVLLPRDEVQRARDLAFAGAGSSSRLRDLGLVLDWALNSARVPSLRRSEVRELERLAAADERLSGLLPLVTRSARRAA
jgi:hypothetical protein